MRVTTCSAAAGARRFNSACRPTRRPTPCRVGCGRQCDAIWKEGASPNEIWSSRYTAGGSWSTPARIGAASQVANGLKVASDRAGNALALWIQTNSTTSRYDLMANRFIVGRGWGTAVLIDANDANRLDSPSIAFDGNGNAVAAWVQDNGVGSIEAARFQ